MEITANLKNYRVSPRKVRLVVDLVRGKRVKEAMTQLAFSGKKSAPIVTKFLKSAVNNAKNNFKIKDADNLIIKKITVDEGRAMRRYMPKARGMANVIKKRSSHVAVVLEEK